MTISRRAMTKERIALKEHAAIPEGIGAGQPGGSMQAGSKGLIADRGRMLAGDDLSAQWTKGCLTVPWRSKIIDNMDSYQTGPFLTLVVILPAFPPTFRAWCIDPSPAPCPEQRAERSPDFRGFPDRHPRDTSMETLVSKARISISNASIPLRPMQSTSRRQESTKPA